MPVRANGADTHVETKDSQALPSNETVVSGWEPTTDMATSSRKDATQVPNWVFPILATALFVLLGFVYATVERQIDQNKADMQKQIDTLGDRVGTEETWRAKTREQLIEHGWALEDDGTLSAPGKGKKHASN